MIKIEQYQWSVENGWRGNGRGLGEKAALVLVFGARQHLPLRAVIDYISDLYPQALIVGCSTAGEIHGTTVRDETLTVAAMAFDQTRIKGAQVAVPRVEDSMRAGRELASRMDEEGLRHVLVLSDGLSVNGSELVKGLMQALPKGVTVTGGLAADGDRFKETAVLFGREAKPNAVVGVGFFSDRLHVGYGSLGGWDPFGPERVVTNSRGNVLYEVDGKSALELYTTYLGPHAEGLPSTGLLFPLSLRADEDDTEPVVRTILSVNEQDRSMTFAGDVPEGSIVRFMKANLDRLVGGAQDAALASLGGMKGSAPAIALLISCVGRKLVLKQRVEEEVEAVREVLGADAAITGFYSYGEISPFTASGTCRLHNQTMTITLLGED